MIKDDLISQEIVPANCDSEAVFVEIILSMTASLILCSICHPSSHGIQQMEGLCTTIEDVMKAHKIAALWLSSDINLPDIRWESHTLTGHQNVKAVNNQFINFLENANM